MIFLVIFFWLNFLNFMFKVVFFLLFICKIFLCYFVGMWFLVNLEKKFYFVLNINVGICVIKKVIYIIWEFCILKVFVYCEWLMLIRSIFLIMCVILILDLVVYDICIFIFGYMCFFWLFNSYFWFFFIMKEFYK